MAFKLMLLPVDHPGQEQKATWLKIRKARPDNILNVGMGSYEPGRSKVCRIYQISNG
jgi:hypothetical protein